MYSSQNYGGIYVLSSSLLNNCKPKQGGALFSCSVVSTFQQIDVESIVGTIFMQVWPLQDTDGCIVELYDHLWQKNSKTGRSCPGISVPETVR